LIGLLGMPSSPSPAPTRSQIEDVERSCLRLVTRAVRDYHHEAVKIFHKETDSEGDIAEATIQPTDVTNEAGGTTLI
jgi:hypothetical protein